MAVIEDKYGRRFRTLRVSLLNHCNLGCVYCVAEDLPGEGREPTAPSSRTAPLSVAALLEMIGRLHQRLGLRTIRLTGGEPLLYKGLVDLIAGIRAIGITDIQLTTNGFLLERLAAPLKAAGLEGLNVSLDAIDEDLFFRMSRRHSAQRIVRGIDAAIATGLSVKINTVLMKGINDTEIIPLMEFAFSRGLRIRFLELMAMGHLLHESGKFLFSQEEILSVISTRYRFSPLGRVGSATASYWLTEEGSYFGIIANESQPFCGDCDRLRLDSGGNIYGCLSNNHPIPLDLEEGQQDWDRKLQEALQQKQATRFTGSDLSMLHIGG